MAKQDTTHHTKPRQFRLSDEINELIDRLAEHYDLNRTDIVRLAVRKLEEQTPNLPPAKRRGKAKT
jgi:predicted transcriptional regulator